ncbi:hypothetical protein [Synechococcus sp. CS-197]|uniref:hypothetical protein n=1 Tax=Synechococcus sp. CS-197 TaxID=2847985 RepID=UPI000152559E|nr:hypothetical protein [Synechococcus sp. CS-197]MCT0251573.1 hypothetical protein [Synechococcus sp. CS-197]CAK23016.1 Conserved hypothetical protein [Synechococcus sp. WH 7803]
MVDPAPLPAKPRALTYTEMMNGGRAQIDAEDHARELELKQREATLELQVSHLEQSLNGAEPLR